MKHLFRAVMLGCMATVLLSTLFLPTAEAKSLLSGSGCSPCRSLNGVAAVSATDVWAVGEYFNSDGTYGTLIEQWNGKKWSIVPSPSPGTSIEQLSGASSVSATDVWAVGYYTNSDDIDSTLIEQWNGTHWSIVPSPNPGSSLNILTGVTAVSATDVWAVGYYISSNGSSGTLIEQWNGTQWNVVASPNFGPGENDLNSIMAVSATNVWAVGQYYTNDADSSGTLTEQWNGTQWSIVTSPSPKTFNFLYGVAAVSATDVWTVGSNTESPDGYYRTLTQQWNGSQWSVVKSPNVGPLEDNLYSVAAVSATDVWAVGDYFSKDYTRNHTLIEQWNGSQWSVVKSANHGSSPANQLNGVTAVSATDVWAVGQYSNSDGTFGALIEQWNGTQWSVIKSPDVGLG